MRNGIDTHILTQKIINGEFSAYCEHNAKYILKTNWYYHKLTKYLRT